MTKLAMWRQMMGVSWRPSGRQTQGRQDPERHARTQSVAGGRTTVRSTMGLSQVGQSTDNAEHLPQKQTPWRPS